MLAACSDRSTGVAPAGGIPSDLLRPALTVLDGSHPGGNPHFFWLPPLVESKKGFQGVADSTQLPAVEICLRDEAADDGCAAGEPLVARFTRTSGRDADRIKTDDKAEYFVHWRMNDFPPQRDGQYRIRVVIQDTELGHADVITMRQKEVKAYNGDLVAISDNGAFKIGFRIEEGALCSEGALGCTTATEVPGDGLATVVDVPAQSVGGDQVVAAVVTVNDGVFTDEDGDPIPDVTVSAAVKITPPSEDVFADDDLELPFFVEIKTFPADVHIDPNGPGVEVVVCQDEQELDNRGIVGVLHPQLILYKVHEGVTRRLISTFGAPECDGFSPAPPAASGLVGMLRRGAARVLGLLGPEPVSARRLHGGLNTVVTRDASLDDAAFSTFGSALGPNAAETEAVFPALGTVGTPVPITIQVKNALGASFLLGGDTLKVAVTAGPSAGAAVTVTDLGGGLYSASYVPQGPGEDVISIVLVRNDGVGLGPIGGSPFTLEVRCFSPSSLAVVTVTLGATCATAGEVPTFDIAMDVVQPGGTILADNGTHQVENVVVDKPVTIGEASGATAVIQNDTARQSFLVDGVASGLVKFQDLDFVNNSPGSNVAGLRTASIRAKGAYDQVVVEGNTFTNVPDSANSGVRADTTTVAGATVLIQNNSFTGGRTGVVATGVATSADPYVTVGGNTFADHVSVAVQFQVGADGDVVGNELTRCGSTCIQYQNTSNGTISGNDVSDCGDVGCIRVFGGNVDVLNNAITDATPPPPDPNAVPFHNAIRFSSGAVGAVNGNTIDGCGWGVCIQIAFGATAEVRDNAITGNEADDTEAGIIGFGGVDDDPLSPNNLAPTLTAVTGNVITGSGTGSGNAGDFDHYAFKINGIMMRNASADSVSGNTITNAARGINVFQNGSIAAGVDNVVDGTLIAVNGYLDSHVSMTDNDFTNWVVAINDSDGTLSGSMQCNWWGTAAGPVGALPPSLAAAFYAPWAVGPVAGAATAACSGAVLDQQNLLDGSLGGQGIGRFSDIDGTPDPSGASFDFQDAQSFTVGITGTLSRVRVPIRNLSGATLGVTLEVVPMDAGAPDTVQVLGSATLPSTAFTGVVNGDPTTWASFDLSTQGIAVTAGEVLAFRVRTESPIAYLYNPEFGSGYTYAAGSGYRRNAAITLTWSPFSTADFGFQTFVSPAPAPVPPAPVAAPAFIAAPVPFRRGGGDGTPAKEARPVVR